MFGLFSRASPTNGSSWFNVLRLVTTPSDPNQNNKLNPDPTINEKWEPDQNPNINEKWDPAQNIKEKWDPNKTKMGSRFD